MTRLGAGDPAPDFTLPGTGGRDYTLSAYRGTPVLLVFYPGDASPVCTRQLSSYNEGIAQFGDLGVQVLALSPQGVQSHEEFSCQQGGFRFPLLADEGKQVGAAYGILGPLGFYKRSVFLVDGAGVVRWAHRSSHGLSYKSTDELLAIVKEHA